MSSQLERTGFGMKLNHYLLLFYPIQYLMYTILISIDRVLTTDLQSLIDTLTIGIPTVSIMLFVLWRKYQSYTDYRFKSGIYFVIALLSVSLATLLIDTEKVIDGALDANKIPALLVILGPTVLVILGAIVSVNQLVSPFEKEVESLSEEINSNNLDAQITTESILSDSIFGPIAGFINTMMASTNNLFKGMTTTSHLISSTAESLASSSESSISESMSSGATQQADMINSIVDQMKDADSVIQEIVRQIQNNTEAVSQIALQTNILALNAGIEASRAGDYGRGFAVVAENVRKLSDQSKNSAEEISSVVDTISTTLQELFDKMQNGIMNVAAVSEETAASAEEVAAAAEEMTSAMEGVSALSQSLATQVVESTNFASIASK
ncbi:MAG: methyl-accepting chemotaxis protein [Candidatus Kariarchaeaceae archaeon]